MAFQNCMNYMTWSGLRKGHSLLFAKSAVETNVRSQNFGSKWDMKKRTSSSLHFIASIQFKTILQVSARCQVM